MQTHSAPTIDPFETAIPVAGQCMRRHADDRCSYAFEFLGLEYHAPKEFKKLNAFPYPDMDPKTREKLQEYFQPHNERLYEFLGQDLGW